MKFKILILENDSNVVRSLTEKLEKFKFRPDDIYLGFVDEDDSDVIGEERYKARGYVVSRFVDHTILGEGIRNFIQDVQGPMIVISDFHLHDPLIDMHSYNAHLKQGKGTIKREDTTHVEAVFQCYEEISKSPTNAIVIYSTSEQASEFVRENFNSNSRVCGIQVGSNIEDDVSKVISAAINEFCGRPLLPASSGGSASGFITNFKSYFENDWDDGVNLNNLIKSYQEDMNIEEDKKIGYVYMINFLKNNPLQEEFEFLTGGHELKAVYGKGDNWK